MKEFDLLAKVYAANATLPPTVTLPPGDDMGAVRIGSSDTLVTVDQIADGIHFELEHTSLERIGRKAITRNLSDVAAMGAIPAGAVVAACLPRDFGEERALALFTAMRQTAGDFQCPLFGGDISMWDGKLILSVTVLAAMPAGISPILRSGAKPGDLICVTGQLGGSLEDLQGYVHHLDFTPRLRVGQKLAADPAIRPSSMLDLSDGLSRDIGHLCSPGGLGATIEIDRLPVSPAAMQAAQRDGQPAWRHALVDGEDYELCFTLAPEKLAAIGREIEGVSITVVGKITADPGVVSCDAQGNTRPMEALGWEHHGS